MTELRHRSPQQILSQGPSFIHQLRTSSQNTAHHEMRHSRAPSEAEDGLTRARTRSGLLQGKVFHKALGKRPGQRLPLSDLATLAPGNAQTAKVHEIVSVRIYIDRPIGLLTCKNMFSATWLLLLATVSSDTAALSHKVQTSKYTIQMDWSTKLTVFNGNEANQKKLFEIGNFNF